MQFERPLKMSGAFDRELHCRSGRRRQAAPLRSAAEDVAGESFEAACGGLGMVRRRRFRAVPLAHHSAQSA